MHLLEWSAYWNESACLIEMLVYKKKFEGVRIREGMFIGRRVLRDIITVISEIFESLSNSLKKKN